MKNKLFNSACFAKSFMLLGDSLTKCFDCSYCRVLCDKNKKESYHTFPTEINSNFSRIPVAINLFYGDPLLQIDNTINLLEKLENLKHKGPVIIITKGDFSKFPDRKFNLDLHVAFSTFGQDSRYDGSNIKIFEKNLSQIDRRKNNYLYSIEFRPICYNINDSEETFRYVLSKAKQYNLAIGYSGLKSKKESVDIWQKEGIDLKPYPGFNFGHKKLISKEKENLFRSLAKEYNVPIFRKTSCLFSYVHGLERDYNAHYYRPNEVGCKNCPMNEKCKSFKRNIQTIDKKLLPFEFELAKVKNHECILKKKGICNFPTEDCSHISGKIIRTKELLTTSDVRLIKWLTGETVDADFYESSKISEFWREQ